MVRLPADRQVLDGGAGRRVDPVQGAAPDGPHQAAGDDRRTGCAARGSPHAAEARRRVARGDGLHAVAARHVDRGAEDCRPPVGVGAAAQRAHVQLTAGAAERGLAEQVAGLGLAHLQGGPVRQQGGRRGPEVAVALVVGLPVGRREELRARQSGRELNDRVAAVVGGPRRAVARGGPDVGGSVDLGGSAAHPHSTLGTVGRRVEDATGATPFGHGDDVAVVRRAVALVAPEPEHDVAVAQVEAGALEDRRGQLTGRVDRLAQQHRAAVDVPPDNEVYG